MSLRLVIHVEKNRQKEIMWLINIYFFMFKNIKRLVIHFAML